MTSDLTEKIERVLADHPVTPPTYAGDLSLAEKRARAAAAVRSVVEEEVRASKAEALRDAADSVHDNASSPYCLPCHRDDAELLHTIATEYETGGRA